MACIFTELTAITVCQRKTTPEWQAVLSMLVIGNSQFSAERPIGTVLDLQNISSIRFGSSSTLKICFYQVHTFGSTPGPNGLHRHEPKMMGLTGYHLWRQREMIGILIAMERSPISTLPLSAFNRRQNFS